MSIEDFVRIYGDNQTMMDSQFNPFIRESTPPIVLNIAITKHERWGDCGGWGIYLPCLKRLWAEIEVEALDVSEFSVTVSISEDDTRTVTFVGKGHEWFMVALDLKLAEVLVTYEVSITMEDFAGNSLDPPYEKEMDGLFGGVLRMLEDLWDWLVDVATAIVDAVAKAVSFILDWLMNMIQAMIDGVIAPILVTYEAWTQGVYYAIDRIMNVGDIDDVDVGLMWATFFTGIYVELLIAAAYVIVYLVESVLLIFLNLIPGLGQVATLLSDSLYRGMKYLGRLALAVAYATLFTMLGEVIAAVVPHGDPFSSAVTATGSFLLALLGWVIIVLHMKKSMDRADAFAMFLILLGFSISMAGAAASSTEYAEHSHNLQGIGAVIAALGLAVGLSSPDLPSVVGLLDEGIGAGLAGWAVYDAFNG